MWPEPLRQLLAAVLPFSEGRTADDDIAARGFAAHIGTHAEARLQRGPSEPADAFCPGSAPFPLAFFERGRPRDAPLARPRDRRRLDGVKIVVTVTGKHGR
jgi:hypothetical protein